MPASTSPARLVGVLFILASVTAIVGGGLVATGSEVTGALLEVVLALSVVAIAALLLPILRRSSEGGAVLYAAVRTLEATLILIGIVAALVATSGTDSPELAPTVREWAYHLGTVLVFAVSAVVLNALLLRGRLAPPRPALARLAPPWLAWWGLAGGVLLAARGAIELYGPLPAAAQAALAAPIGIQEMVFAVWLIARRP
ncbi:DUF4386 domain-containing protein [Actinoplanes sp. CA-142083]|uniref:DUF4386 domain-containing protein n=1 Tax=Actinoplanes sp. CA-142083 TaxID=3239903 RepID=UPI003D933838